MMDVAGCVWTTGQVDVNEQIHDYNVQDSV